MLFMNIAARNLTIDRPVLEHGQDARATGFEKMFLPL